jgi:predicted enzyme related to lactoylglutathione lyase
MSTKAVRTDDATSDTKTQLVDMKLEVIVIPVSDVDRAKGFYQGLGWRLDAEFAGGDDFRIMQSHRLARGPR